MVPASAHVAAAATSRRRSAAGCAGRLAGWPRRPPRPHGGAARHLAAVGAVRVLVVPAHPGVGQSPRRPARPRPRPRGRCTAGRSTRAGSPRPGAAATGRRTRREGVEVGAPARQQRRVAPLPVVAASAPMFSSYRLSSKAPSQIAARMRVRAIGSEAPQRSSQNSRNSTSRSGRSGGDQARHQRPGGLGHAGGGQRQQFAAQRREVGRLQQQRVGKGRRRRAAGGGDGRAGRSAAGTATAPATPRQPRTGAHGARVSSTVPGGITVPLGITVTPSRIQRYWSRCSFTSGCARMMTPSPMRAFLSMMQRSSRQLRPTPIGGRSALAE